MNMRPLQDRLGSSFWKGWGMMQQGCLSALTGNARGSGSNNYGSASISMRSTETTMWMPLFLSHLAKANAEIGQFDEASTKIGEAMTAVKKRKRIGTKPRSIASPGKSLCREWSRMRQRLKPVSPARLRLLGSRKRNPGSSERQRAWRDCCAFKASAGRARHSCSSLWLVHRGFRHARLAGGRALARGIGARSAN